MSNTTLRIPSLRYHKPSGQAVVTLGGRDIYLGKHRSAASRAEYQRLIAEWTAHGGSLPPATSNDLTIMELSAAFIKHAQQYYRSPAGRRTSEVACFRAILKRLKLLYGRTRVVDFGPIALKTLRQQMIDDGLARTTINQNVHRIRRMFRWALESEMIEPGVLQRLEAVSGLRAGRRVEDYPLKAWEREGGDGKDGPRSERIEEFLMGERVGRRRTGDGRIKREMRDVIDSRFSGQSHLFPDAQTTTESVVAQARAEYEQLHDLPSTDPDERERFYREHIEGSEPLRTLQAAMDEWCAVWFWPTDEESLRSAPTPLTFHKPSAEKNALVERVAGEVKFFHWEVEFPDVFTPERSGFDGVLGNPPWEVMKPNSKEFFSDYDPLYRTYGKQTALRRQRELFNALPGLVDSWAEYNAAFKGLNNCVKHLAAPFDLSLTRGKRDGELHAKWKDTRRRRRSLANPDVPFHLQGSADLNSYKLFLEVTYHLLARDGRFGYLVPAALYTDSGSKELREQFLNRSEWEWVFGFENKKKIFDIHGSFKFAVVIVSRQRVVADNGQRTLRAAFMIHDVAAWERPDPLVFDFDRGLIPLFSPRSMCLPEVRTRRDLEICRRIYDNSLRIGDNAPGWEISYSREFHMTDDSTLFPPLDKWKGNGFQPDEFGRWNDANGDSAVPLYEGRMVGQFDFSEKGWVSGKGRSAVWKPIPFDSKQPEPQFLMNNQTFRGSGKSRLGHKIVGMSVTSSTNSRTVVTCTLVDAPTIHALFTLIVKNNDLVAHLYLCGLLNTLAFDYVARQRLGGLNLSWFILEECPLPLRGTLADAASARLIALNSARLALGHRAFCPLWLKLRCNYLILAAIEWKHWWAVTEADRLRLRIEIDTLSADLYGLDPDDFDWIVRDDPTDPKGFHRVDKNLAFRERLTGLTAAAFRALKDGKWSPESAATLSNDEFFDILGIPELTSAQAAQANGLPGPLILKRDGCHEWHPERFPESDPRYGWTWEHCRQDAIALLGSEEALEKYLAGETTPAPAAESSDGDATNDEPFQLRSEPPKPKQGKMF